MISHFSKDIDGQQLYEKMLNRTSHQGNADQNHNEVLAHTCLLARMWRKGNPGALWMEMQIGAAT